MQSDLITQALVIGSVQSAVYWTRQGVVADAICCVVDGDAHGLDKLVLRHAQDESAKSIHPRLPHLLTKFRTKVLAHVPENRVARNALACLYLEQRPDFAVDEFLNLREPRSEYDWRDFHVAAMAKAKRRSWDEAEAMLRRGIRETPFARHRTVFATSLSFVLLQRRRFDEIEAVLDAAVASGQVVRFPLRTVLKAQASALMNQSERSARLIDEAQQSGDRKIVVLTDLIRKQYGIGRTAEPSVQLESEIDDMEFSLLLRAA